MLRPPCSRQEHPTAPAVYRPSAPIFPVRAKQLTLYHGLLRFSTARSRSRQDPFLRLCPFGRWTPHTAGAHKKAAGTGASSPRLPPPFCFVADRMNERLRRSLFPPAPSYPIVDRLTDGSAVVDLRQMAPLRLFAAQTHQQAPRCPRSVNGVRPFALPLASVRSDRQDRAPRSLSERIRHTATTDPSFHLSQHRRPARHALPSASSPM